MAADEKFTALNRELHKYLLDHGHNGDPLLAELAEETRKLGQIAGMQIAAEQGTLMGILARAIGARNAVEVGTFTGYSAICIARALPPDGHLLCCDVHPEWTGIARRYWERAGLTGKITLKLAPAVETLRALPSDFVIDLSSSTPTRSTIALITRNASNAPVPMASS
jgi:predicted O-methyltransferase YrrM